MFEWRQHRDEYAAELLRHHGCGDFGDSSCAKCLKASGVIRCKRCHGRQLYCGPCAVEIHKENPLHVVEEWDGRCFKYTSLTKLGLRIEFGHADCIRPHLVDDFVVLDVGAVHVVNISYCGCTQAFKRGPLRTQLLRGRWYPATHEFPRTAATFDCLDFFLAKTLQAKTTMYDFYTALERLTDGTGGSSLNRYAEFLRMVRQYRHLKMLVRGGRGQCNASGLPRNRMSSVSAPPGKPSE
ncbi:hypothetical protein C8F04DRAFT_940077 [Mycena alexandri]|uniref:CxC2-like cysteine cluster KDZ transposase-associated domain-containing protein n=1 Tax=Mycena alexandri TaxID=1745969 RepID=A0AAD6XET9_9AGAR|nr:hypothetical protein C8F04DRAFT_940077 [Mycena alexandri]